MTTRTTPNKTRLAPVICRNGKNNQAAHSAAQKVLVMVTENSKDSRWVPWELGYADPVKGMDHIASLPVAETYGFTQNEYLKIYPKIYFVNKIWWIWRDDPQKLTELTAWLRQ